MESTETEENDEQPEIYTKEVNTENIDSEQRITVVSLTGPNFYDYFIFVVTMANY